MKSFNIYYKFKNAKPGDACLEGEKPETIFAGSQEAETEETAKKLFAEYIRSFYPNNEIEIVEVELYKKSGNRWNRQ